MTVAAIVARYISQHGESATLSRTGEGTTITLYAKRYGAAELDFGGTTAAQATMTVRIAPTELAASAWTDKFPKRHDKLLIAGRTCIVREVDTRKDGATTMLHILTVSG